MKPLFADTFYFIALLSPDDVAHERAVDYSRLIEQSVTTEWVLLELADGLAGTRNRHLFKETRDALLDDPPAEVVPFDTALHERAIELYVKMADKDWSLTDCVSFLVMQDRRLTEALTADRHFEQAGFVALLK
jgi:predicted nucleic acid-binding protein